MLEFISSDNANEKIEESTADPLTKYERNNHKNDSDSIVDLSLLTNKDFKSSTLAYEITEILPLNSGKANFKIKTLNKTKINILTHHQDGSVFF